MTVLPALVLIDGRNNFFLEVEICKGYTTREIGKEKKKKQKKKNNESENAIKNEVKCGILLDLDFGEFLVQRFLP